MSISKIAELKMLLKIERLRIKASNARKRVELDGWSDASLVDKYQEADMALQGAMLEYKELMNANKTTRELLRKSRKEDE